MFFINCFTSDSAEAGHAPHTTDNGGGDPEAYYETACLPTWTIGISIHHLRIREQVSRATTSSAISLAALLVVLALQESTNLFGVDAIEPLVALDDED